MTQLVAIGVDVGGTKIAAVAVDISTGLVLIQDKIPTQRHDGGARVLDRLVRMIKTMQDQLQKMDIHSLGVGIGIPELVNNDGVIKANWNFDWDKRSISDQLAEFGTVILESDARTAALAEHHFGHGNSYPSFVFVTIGSGISFSFCKDGNIHRGANGYAIHFGSSDILAICSDCGSQSAFNLEALASGRGLAETYRNRTSEVTDARSLVDDDCGDAAKLLVDQATSALASYLGQLVNIFDPHAVIIGGGLGLAPKFFEILEHKIRPHVLAPECRSIPIVKSAILENGAAIGAAVLFRAGADKQ